MEFAIYLIKSFSFHPPYPSCLFGKSLVIKSNQVLLKIINDLQIHELDQVSLQVTPKSLAFGHLQYNLQWWKAELRPESEGKQFLQFSKLWSPLQKRTAAVR